MLQGRYVYCALVLAKLCALDSLKMSPGSWNVYKILVVLCAVFVIVITLKRREYSLSSGFLLYFAFINKDGKFAVAKYRPIFKALYAVYGFRTENG
jgi:hypothetical protein